MSASFAFEDRVALVTGAAGALGSAVAAAFADAGATVVAVDLLAPDNDDALIEDDAYDTFHEADLTEEAEVEAVVDEVRDEHGGIDHLANVAGTWRGGQPIEETDVEQFRFLYEVNLTSAFLTTKHALPHLQDAEGTVVSISARSSLEGGEGDGPYRASKAGIRIFTETVAEENRGTVRANCVMPSVLDTPMNREMMTHSDDWVDTADVARTILTLSSDATPVTSGAAVPVYGEA
jgi:NAD(P)-dependent dehydrogenase (short-subunit alcohol dehydrogenase family)